jgi:Low-density lipoprotein receptor domain class A
MVKDLNLLPLNRKLKERLMKKLVFVMVIVFGFMACDDDDSSNQCQDAFNALDGCGLMSEGAYDCADFPTGGQELCEVNCMLSSTCEDLEQTMCTATPVATIIDCFDGCEETHGFECTDGEFVDEDAECNGWEECTDGSDEEGCPQFVCDDDERVQINAECNGWEECTDGSDEVGCTMWMCDDGVQEILENQRCSFYEDCTDGSDEAGCPNTFECTDGQIIHEDYECDGDDDCNDGTDEHNGCPEYAEMTCP